MTKDSLAPFARQKYLSLETLRRNGQAVATPVWFAESAGVLYVYSLAESGKIKRIRNNPQVRVAPCDMRGNLKGGWLAGAASLLENDEARRAGDLLNRKYGWQKRILNLFAHFRPRPRAYVAIRLD